MSDPQERWAEEHYGTTEQDAISGNIENVADAFGLVKWFGSRLVDRFTDFDASRGLRVDVVIKYRPAGSSNDSLDEAIDNG